MPTSDLIQRTIEQFWDTIPRVWRRVHGVARENAAHYFDLTFIQFDILRSIRRGVCSAAGLAQQHGISRPAVSQTVDQLVEKGLVSRRTDLSDRRFIQLDLTPGGEQLIAQLFTINRRWMMEELNGLSNEELETVITALIIMKKTFVESPE
jgi:DNA-binding MarR family transcriptional regulator